MRPDSNDHKHSSVNTTADNHQLSNRSLTAEPAQSASVLTEDHTLKLIPWSDIWSSLRVARVRGNGEMIEVFYDTLFREAIFDDQGAWSWNTKRHN